MSDNLQAENIDRVFALLDMDGDGVVSGADFQAMGGGIAREFGLDADSEQAQRLVAGYVGVWDYIRGADIDADSEVSRTEFHQAHESGRLETATVVEKWESASRQSFEAADHDGDGYIDVDGFAGILRGAGVSDPEVPATAFGDMDVDGDGRLDWTELSAHVRGLFTANDESVKGSRMLGGS
ncbi:EF-hand domain-containing protein [Actinokineospora sp. 24-640]